MRILAFDQASIKTAWSFFSNSTLVAYNLINLQTKSRVKDKKDRGKENEQRFLKMLQEIQNTIIKNKPDIIIFEDVSLQTNVSVLVKLARIQGCIITECIRNKIPYIIYKPSEWRKVLNFKQGRGVPRNDLKKQAISFVTDRYEIDNLNDDIAEAICIGLACIKDKYNNFKEIEE